MSMSATSLGDDEQVQALRRKMAALRKELKGDVDEVSCSARAMTDWRYYVKRFPWTSVALAAVAGYCLVPKRTYVVSPGADDLAQLAKNEKLVVTNKATPKSSNGLIGMLISLAVTGAARAAMAYVGEQLGAMSAKADQTERKTNSSPANVSPSNERTKA